MPISGFGPPGERVTRFASAKEDIIHILYAATCAAPSCLLALAGLYGLCVLYGPDLGYCLGFVGIFAIHNPIARWARKSRDEGRRMLVIIGFVLACVAWGMAGQRILAGAGWPEPLRMNQWHKFWIAFGIVAVEGVIGFATYALVREIVDPSSPSPRKAISRDTPVWPWTRETYDGRTLFPTIPVELPEPEPAYRRVEVHATDSNGSEKICRDIPDTPGWWDFLKAVVEGASFSEPEARRWKARGYRRIMHDLMSNEKNWIKWHNPENNLEGVDVTPEGMQVFAGIVAEGRPGS